MEKKDWFKKVQKGLAVFGIKNKIHKASWEPLFINGLSPKNAIYENMEISQKKVSYYLLHELNYAVL